MNKNNSNKLKYLLKNTAIFAISNLATKLITFFLIPLYTYCLTTTEYGVVDLLFTLCTVLIPVMTLNSIEGVYRFSMDKGANNNKIVSIGILMFFLCAFLGLLLLPLFGFFPNYAKYKYLFYFYLITSAGYQIFSVNLKGQEKLMLFSIGNILNTILIAFFNILFLKVFNLKIEGYFLAYIVSNFISLIFVIIVGKVIGNLKNFIFDKKLFLEMSKYSVVLIPTSFMWWIMKSSDRVMLTYYSGLAINGIYAVSYKIPTILQAIATIFNQAWVFTAVKEKDSFDNEKYTNSIFEKLYFNMFILAACLTVFIKPFFSFYVSQNYYSAWKYVPFLLIGSLFVTFATFLSSSYNAHKDSKGFLFSGIAGAIINIILNILLIPKFDAYGAAIATGISYIAVFIYRFIDTQKYVKIKFKKDFIMPIVLLAILSLLLYIDNIFSFIIQILIMLLMIIFYRDKWYNLIKVVAHSISQKRRQKNER